MTFTALYQLAITHGGNKNLGSDINEPVGLSTRHSAAGNRSHHRETAFDAPAKKHTPKFYPLLQSNSEKYLQ